MTPTTFPTSNVFVITSDTFRMIFDNRDDFHRAWESFYNAAMARSDCQVWDGMIVAPGGTICCEDYYCPAQAEFAAAA